MNLVAFYNELIQKEREEFQRVLKSRLCIERSEINKKVKAKQEKAERQIAKVG